MDSFANQYAAAWLESKFQNTGVQRAITRDMDDDHDDRLLKRLMAVDEIIDELNSRLTPDKQATMSVDQISEIESRIKRWKQFQDRQK